MLMDAASTQRARALTKSLREVIYFADEETTGDELIAALGAVAGEAMAGQETEEAGLELLGKLIVATHIAELTCKGCDVRGMLNGKA